MTAARVGMQSALERMGRARAAVLARVEAMPAPLRDRPPRAGAWSAVEVVEHLVIAEELTLHGLLHPRAPGARGSAVAASIRLQLLRVLFASPARVRAPSARLLPSGGQALEPLLARWEAASGGIAEWVLALPPERGRERPFRHPVCGWLRADQMLTFHEAHLRHHARQVTRTHRAVVQQAAGGVRA